jgi:hypothetical protein
MIRGVSFALMFVVCLATGGLARAQDQAATTLPPAHIATADGAATLERNGRGEAAVANTPLLEGDRLRTDVGRLDLLLPDGSAVELDRYTTVDLLSGGLVRLATGRLVFAVTGQSGSATVYEVDTPAGRVRLSEPGEYRVSTLEAPGTVTVNVSVVRGVALVGASVAVRDGEKVILQNGQVLTGPEPFNVEQPDAFYQWADLRRHVRPQRHVGQLSRLRVRLVPDGGTRLAPLLRRLVAALLVGLDLDRGRAGLDLAHAPLWPVGLRCARLVLDPGGAVGPGVGGLEHRRRLRGLVRPGFR